MSVNKEARREFKKRHNTKESLLETAKNSLENQLVHIFEPNEYKDIHGKLIKPGNTIKWRVGGDIYDIFMTTLENEKGQHQLFNQLIGINRTDGRQLFIYKTIENIEITDHTFDSSAIQI